MEVVTEILESNLVSAIIALIGVIISLKWSMVLCQDLVQIKMRGSAS